MRGLVSYYGGKARLASRIVEILQQIPHTVFGEPFCGGASVLFAKPIPYHTNKDHYREFINDTNQLMTTLYRVGKTQPQQLIERIDATLYSQSDYKKAVEICKSPEQYSDLDIAWAVVVNCEQSFSNKLNAGWGTGIVTRNHAATWTSYKHQLPAMLDRIKSVYVSCEDALKCIKRWDSPQALIYADPPYPGTNQGHYSGYTVDDWQALCDLLDASQCSYVLSNYYQEIQPKSAQEIIKIDAVMSASKPSGTKTEKQDRGDIKRIEYLWVCDRSQHTRSDLKTTPTFQGLQQGVLF